MPENLYPLPPVEVDYGGFRASNVFDTAEEGRLKGLLQKPKQINLNKLADGSFGVSNEEQLARLEADRMYEDTMTGTVQNDETARAQQLSRGIGLGPLAQEEMMPVLQSGEEQRAAAREYHKGAVGEARATAIDRIKTQLAQREISKINRSFSRQMQQFQREFGKYRRTTEAKFGDELRQTERVMKERSDNAWRNVTMSLEGGRRRGGIIGGILGGVAGAVGAFFTGNVGLIGAGVSAGRGIGSAAGTARGSNDAYYQVNAY